MNAQPQFTGTRFHRRELRYTQAPAQEYVQPLTARQCYPIEHTPHHNSRLIRHTIFSVVVGLLVTVVLLGCGPDDVATERVIAEDVAQAQAQAVQAHKEAVALAALMGSKQ